MKLSLWEGGGCCCLAYSAPSKEGKTFLVFNGFDNHLQSQEGEIAV